MYSLIVFIILCSIACFFNKYKNKMLKRPKSIINLLFESVLQVICSYILTTVSLRLIKNISILHTFSSIVENRLKFTIKFNAISFVYLALFLSLSFILKTEIKHSIENKKKAYVFSFIFIFFVVLFFMLILYIDAMFPYLDIDQVLFTLSMPMTGTSHLIIATFIIMVLIIPLCFSIFHLILQKININFSYTLPKNKERIFFPLRFKHRMLASIIFIAIVFLFFNLKLNLFGYVLKELKGNTTFYEENYISPKDVTFTFPEHKKNLIFIYLESTEAEISSHAKEGTNLIPELTELTKNNLSFSHSDGIGGQMQVSGTSHSIASICCTHLGLPLLIDVGGRFYKNSKHFFNGAYGLGNILQGGGYNCLFVIGSETAYGGLDNLLKNHAFEVKDINYYKSINKVPKDYSVWWGIEDAKMVEIAKEELTKISSLEKPFAFSVFFEDTHFPSGYFDKECENKDPKQIHNVFANMSRRMNNFVGWIKEQPFYKDSIIVILGDHLYMGDDLYDDGRPNSKRHAYNVFINTSKSDEHSKNRNFCTFDYFPTIIDCLDIKYNADGLGLGRSLLTGKPTLLEQLGKNKLEEDISGKSDFYRYSLLSKE